MTWKPPTYLDDVPATDPATRIRCGRCARLVHADMLTRVTALPDALRGAASYWCDGCREAAIACGAIDRETFAELLGATGADLREIRRRLDADPHARGRQKRAIDPTQLRPLPRRPDAEQPHDARRGPRLGILFGDAGVTRPAVLLALTILGEFGVMVQALDTSSIGTVLRDGVLLAIGGWLAVSFLRFQHSTTKTLGAMSEATTKALGDVATAVGQVRQELIGMDGRGGMLEDVRSLRKRQHELANHVMQVMERVGAIQDWIGQAQFRLNIPASPSAIEPLPLRDAERRT